MEDQHRNTEEQYFNEESARLRQRMREDAEKVAKEERHRKKLAEAVGTDDAAVIDRLRSLGLDGDMAPVLHLLPVVGVAWADDNVSKAERAAVMKLAEARGIDPESKAALFLASILEERPDPAVGEAILDVLRSMIKVRGGNTSSLIEACEAIASASGGLLGLGIGNKISAEERAEIERIAAAAGDAAQKRMTDALE